MAKLTKDGLKKVKAKTMLFAQQGDDELNKAIQDFVIQINRLIASRST